MSNILELLKNKNILIIGGASGLGRFFVERFAKYNCVLFLDINKEEGELCEKSLKEKDCQVYYIYCDLEDDDSLRKAFAEIKDVIPSLDGMIHCARYRYLDESENLLEWDSALNVMLTSAQKCCIEAFELLKGSSGSIINISSPAAESVSSQPLSYHIAKAGLQQLTKYFSKIYGKFNIRVNAISPGYIVKDQSLEYFNENPNRLLVEKIHPLGRIGRAYDLYNCLEFLLSDFASFITGQIITIDGGLSLTENSTLLDEICREMKN